MGNYLNLVQVPRLQLEHITDQNIKDFLESVDFSKRFNLKKKSLEKYLHICNNRIFEQSASDEELRTDYIISMCAYLFADPLLDIKVDEKIKDGFIVAVNNAYGISDPLELKFFKTQMSDEDMLYDVSNTRDDISMNLKMTDSTKDKIKTRLAEISNMIEPHYSLDLHYQFSGYFNVCSRLFKIRTNERIETCNEYLQDKKGSFYFSVPKTL